MKNAWNLLQPWAMVFAVIYVWVSWSACTQRYYYAPNAAILPDLRAQDDLDLVIASTGGDQLSGVEIDLAYSPYQYVGIGSRFFFSGSSSLDGESGRHQFFQWEVLAGGYYPLHQGDGISLQVGSYLSYANGRVTNYYLATDQTFSRLHYRRWSMLPGLLFDFGPFHMALSARLGRLGYRKALLHGDIMEDDLNEILLATHSPVFLVEPFVKMGVGFRAFKVFMGVTRTHYSQPPILPIEDVMLTVGFQLALGQPLRKLKERKKTNLHLSPEGRSQ